MIFDDATPAAEGHLSMISIRIAGDEIERGTLMAIGAGTNEIGAYA